jgi:hypothetical protein
VYVTKNWPDPGPVKKTVPSGTVFFAHSPDPHRSNVGGGLTSIAVPSTVHTPSLAIPFKVQKTPVFRVYLHPMHHLNSQKRHFALSRCDMNC